MCLCVRVSWVCASCACPCLCVCQHSCGRTLGSSSLPTRGNPAGSSSPGPPRQGACCRGWGGHVALLQPHSARLSLSRGAPVLGSPCPGVSLSPGCLCPRGAPVRAVSHGGRTGAWFGSCPWRGSSRSCAGCRSSLHPALRARPSSFPFKVICRKNPRPPPPPPPPPPPLCSACKRGSARGCAGRGSPVQPGSVPCRPRPRPHPRPRPAAASAPLLPPATWPCLELSSCLEPLLGCGSWHRVLPRPPSSTSRPGAASVAWQHRGVPRQCHAPRVWQGSGGLHAGRERGRAPGGNTPQCRAPRPAHRSLSPQVGQVFLYFQWDSLLLEAGFLGVLVAPLRLFRWRSAAWRAHDGVTFWLVRWLLFRLMFASGVVKLTSRCPTWWGLTALTYHYETQCIPTPAAWFAHQLPVWFQKLSVVATYVIEIAVPLLFFAPIRRLRLFAFYCQVLLQVLIILTGNYNFFNALTIVLAFSLLDEEHVAYWLGRSKKKHAGSWPPSLLAFLSTLLELAAYALLLYWSVQHFGLEIDWEKKVLESKVAFTYHEFTQWLRTVTLPLVGVGFLSLSWEILSALYRCISVRGCFWKLWALLQWAVFATAAVGVFAVSLVPFTYIDYESNGKLWPGIHHMFNAVERFQVVNSYGLFRRMTGVGGRPEVVLEGSYDKQTWTEIEFMYKPGNVSAAPPLVAPHQPRLDWQMWFAALGHHSSSPWFASFVYRLLQGKKDVIRLVQLDEAKYPFSAQPPTYIRAQLYKYWFTGSTETGEGATRWWRRQHVQEFFPTVSLGDPTLESLLAQHGLKDKAPPKRPATTFLPWLLESIRRLSLPFSGPAVLWSLYLGAASAALLRALARRPRGGAPPARHKGPKRGDPVDRGGGEKNGQALADAAGSGPPPLRPPWGQIPVPTGPPPPCSPIPGWRWAQPRAGTPGTPQKGADEPGSLWKCFSGSP
uniref:Lipase maturation factor n=1 Tax=Cairina moschata TaxID=8855 RepID=A0A8C3B744_CAIMO